MNSFLKSVDSFLKLIPDHKPQGISEKIQLKCSVLYFPLQFPFIVHSEEIALDSQVIPTSEDYTAEAQQTNSEATVVESLPHIQTEKGTAAVNSSTETCSSLQSLQTHLCMESARHLDNSIAVCSARVRIPLHIVWPHRW